MQASKFELVINAQTAQTDRMPGFTVPPYTKTAGTLQRASELRTLRGLVALERGDTTQATQHFQGALDTRIGFSDRPIAARYLELLRGVPVQMVVGDRDVETWEINNPGHSNWMDGAERTGRNCP